MNRIVRALFATLLGATLGSAAYAAPVCSVGNNAEVLWKNKWYGATVTRVNETQTKCFIHYKGYGTEWDEWVGADRIRIIGGGNAAPPAASWSVGDSVAVLWQNKWYGASIIERKQGLYKVHYDGYASSWDEWVESNRIRSR